MKKVLNIFKYFYTNTNQFGCLPPCRITHFEIDVKLYHENSLFLYEKLTSAEDSEKSTAAEHGFTLLYFYKTLRVEEKIETFIFDLGGVLAAAGGNLGLCLGFSCLSILHTMVAFISHLMKKIIFTQ